MTMPTKSYDADYFRKQLADEQEKSAGAGQRNEYLKLTGGQNEIRLLPGEPLFAAMRKHGYKDDAGKFTSALDYGFIKSNPWIGEAAIAKGTITGDDLAAGEEFGDPFTTLAVTAKDLGLDEELIRPLWPRTRYLWNAVDLVVGDSQVRLFESSKQFFDQIAALFEKAPDLFDPEKGRNIGIKGNGKNGIARRYDSPIADFNQSAVGFDFKPNLIDLNAVVVRAVRPWAEKARAMFAKHGDLAAQVGVTPDAWGL